MTFSGTDQARENARELAGMFTEIDRHRRTLSHRASLGTADMRLLWLLSDEQPRSLRQIAERLGLEQSTANRQVNAALTAGLLDRERAAASEPYQFTPTAYGLHEFDHNLHTSLDTYGGALESLGTDRGQLLSLLRGFLDALDNALSDERANPGTPASPLHD